MAKEIKGKLTQVVGPIVDVMFSEDHLPELLTALTVKLDDGKTLTLEVAQHIGDDIVRAVSMGPTEGLKRGMEVISTESPITVPVGEETLGRIFNVLGEPLDDLDNKSLKEAKRLPIHRDAAKFKDPSVNSTYSVSVSSSSPKSGKKRFLISRAMFSSIGTADNAKIGCSSCSKSALEGTGADGCNVAIAVRSSCDSGETRTHIAKDGISVNWDENDCLTLWAGQ